MDFDEKLKQAMQQLGINQAQLVGMTGIGKSSISQYLSGKNVPSEERQKNIAVSLGLAPNYFEREVPVVTARSTNNISVPRLDVQIAAKLLGMNHNTIRKGLQQGIFPWGYAIHTSENRWTYFINAIRFSEIERIDLGLEKGCHRTENVLIPIDAENDD
nr:helix-turn-helix transcriptional regulator [uncultured Clostridium sp.]